MTRHSQKRVLQKKYILFFLAVFTLTGALLAPLFSQQKEEILPEWTLFFTNREGKKVPLYVEVAATRQSRQRGLMYRSHLEPDHGMIFVFETPHILSFWMKNTSIPLSIAYADQERIIREIYPLEPHNETPVVSKNKALFAIEVSQGWFQKNHIGPGSKFELKLQSH